MSCIENYIPDDDDLLCKETRVIGVYFNNIIIYNIEDDLLGVVEHTLDNCILVRYDNHLCALYPKDNELIQIGRL